MSRTKRAKLDRTNNAAYAASQPLFNAIRSAITATLKHQVPPLLHARDVVQSLHVKIDLADSQRHEDYMTAIVKAWTSVTRRYCDIFGQLVLLSAPVPTEGRAAGKNYEEVLNMLETARQAQSVAFNFGLDKRSTTASTADEENSKFEGKEEEEEDSEEEDEIKGGYMSEEQSEMEPASFVNATGKRAMVHAGSAETRAAEPHTRAQQNQPPLVAGTRYSKDGTKLLWENGQLKVTKAELSSDELKSWNLFKRQRQKILSRAQNEAHKDTVEQTQPVIEFEDVSAAVEARIQAKEAKRKAAKAAKTEKKRKRESGDSFVTGDAVGEGKAMPQTSDLLAALEESIAAQKSNKPVKKKTKKLLLDACDSPPAEKSNNGAALQNSNAGESEKRKNEVDADAAADNISGSSKKKRKKSKT